jgi:hypothetical protein
MNAEPGGYSVVVVSHNLPGFLPTQALLRPGEEILAQYVCMHNHRVLLSARFSNNQVNPSVSDPIPGASVEDALIRRMEINPAHLNQQPQPLPWNMHTAKSEQRKFHYKRATDLILPPIDPESLEEFKMGDYDLEWLITNLEGGKRTGCVKAVCDRRQSRSAMLLYRGRVVGCVHNSTSRQETPPSEQSLQSMLGDLEMPETLVEVYDLPENVILAMSALFLGYPVQRNDDYDARKYMDYICDWFESKASTGCLAITLPSFAATCLGFVYKGQFVGAFNVESQEFSTNKEFVYELFRKDSKSNMDASMLPPEVTSSAVRFGFSLSMADRQRRNKSEQ